MEFTKFISKAGTSGYVFEIKKSINNGALLWTKYFTVTDGTIAELEGEFSQKAHAFKNYKCDKHNLFYNVDLYEKSGKSSYNYHHMRLVPFTKLNKEFYNQFMADMSQASKQK